GTHDAAGRICSKLSRTRSSLRSPIACARLWMGGWSEASGIMRAVAMVDASAATSRRAASDTNKHAVRKGPSGPRRHFKRKSRLAAAAGTGEGDHAVRLDRPGDVRQLYLAADEARHGRRQV